MGIFEDIQKSIERQKKVASDFFNHTETTDFIKSVENDIEKGKKAELGEVRYYSGIPYRKVSSTGNSNKDWQRVKDMPKNSSEKSKESKEEGKTFSPSSKVELLTYGKNRMIEVNPSDKLKNTGQVVEHEGESYSVFEGSNKKVLVKQKDIGTIFPEKVSGGNGENKGGDKKVDKINIHKDDIVSFSRYMNKEGWKEEGGKMVQYTVNEDTGKESKVVKSLEEVYNDFKGVKKGKDEEEKSQWEDVVMASGVISRLKLGNDKFDIYHHHYPKVPKGEVAYLVKKNGDWLGREFVKYGSTVGSNEEIINELKNKVLSEFGKTKGSQHDIEKLSEEWVKAVQLAGKYEGKNHQIYADNRVKANKIEDQLISLGFDFGSIKRK